MTESLLMACGFLLFVFMVGGSVLAVLNFFRLSTLDRKIRELEALLFRLLYGNPRAERPEYELGRLLDGSQMDEAPLGALGAEERNAGFVSSEPFTERHPVLIWAALALAVVVLSAMAVKSLR